MFCSFIRNDLLGKELLNDLLLHAQKHCSTFSHSLAAKRTILKHCFVIACSGAMFRSLNNGLFLSAQTQCSVAAFSEFCCQNTTQSLFRQKSALGKHPHAADRTVNILIVHGESQITIVGKSQKDLMDI